MAVIGQIQYLVAAIQLNVRPSCVCVCATCGHIELLIQFIHFSICNAFANLGNWLVTTNNEQWEEK